MLNRVHLMLETGTRMDKKRRVTIDSHREPPNYETKILPKLLINR